MSGKFFSSINIWHLPTSALAVSLKEMAVDGMAGNEGVTLWLGHRAHGEAEVTHLVGLRGPGVIKKPDFLRIESWLLNDVTDLAIKLGVRLIGQIHSHGKWYGTDLSETDRRYGLAVPYYLSIVAPDYGLCGDTQLEDCGVHIFEPGYGYRRMEPTELRARLILDPKSHISFITVGEGHHA